METLASRLDPASGAFAANRDAQLQLVEDLRKRLADAALGGPEKSRERHVARGKLLPRERIDQLLDDGSPFLEIAPLAANGMYNDDAPGAGVIAGIGLVHGRQVLVISNDATVKGGTYYPADGQEAPPRPGNRPGKQAAVHLPGGFGRSLPAQAGRGLPGQGPLRPDLLQPGHACPRPRSRSSPP